MKRFSTHYSQDSPLKEGWFAGAGYGSSGMSMGDISARAEERRDNEADEELSDALFGYQGVARQMLTGMNATEINPWNSQPDLVHASAIIKLAIERPTLEHIEEAFVLMKPIVDDEYFRSMGYTYRGNVVRKPLWAYEGKIENLSSAKSFNAMLTNVGYPSGSFFMELDGTGRGTKVRVYVQKYSIYSNSIENSFINATAILSKLYHGALADDIIEKSAKDTQTFATGPEGKILKKFEKKSNSRLKSIVPGELKKHIEPVPREVLKTVQDLNARILSQSGGPLGIFKKDKFKTPEEIKSEIIITIAKLEAEGKQGAANKLRMEFGVGNDLPDIDKTFVSVSDDINLEAEIQKSKKNVDKIKKAITKTKKEYERLEKKYKDDVRKENDRFATSIANASSKWTEKRRDQAQQEARSKHNRALSEIENASGKLLNQSTVRLNVLVNQLHVIETDFEDYIGQLTAMGDERKDLIKDFKAIKKYSDSVSKEIEQEKIKNIERPVKALNDKTPIVPKDIPPAPKKIPPPPEKVSPVVEIEPEKEIVREVRPEIKLIRKELDKLKSNMKQLESYVKSDPSLEGKSRFRKYEKRGLLSAIKKANKSLTALGSPTDTASDNAIKRYLKKIEKINKMLSPKALNKAKKKGKLGPLAIIVIGMSGSLLGAAAVSVAGASAVAGAVTGSGWIASWIASVATPVMRRSMKSKDLSSSDLEKIMNEMYEEYSREVLNEDFFSFRGRGD